MAKKLFTTREAAKKIGISRARLYVWMEHGKIVAPESFVSGSGYSIRLWTKAQIDAARKVKGTLKTGRPRKDGKK